MKSYGVTIQLKATEQYFPVILCIVLNKVVLISLPYSQTCPSVRIITPWQKHLIKKNFQSSSDQLKQFSKKSFSSTEEERASDDKKILNVTIMFLVYLENFVNNLLDKKYSLSSAEL